MKYDLELAHHFSNNHKPELENDNKCGCFYCLTVFEPTVLLIILVISAERQSARIAG